MEPTWLPNNNRSMLKCPSYKNEPKKGPHDKFIMIFKQKDNIWFYI